MHQAIRDIYHTTNICCGGDCNVDNTSGNINSLVGEQRNRKVLHAYIAPCILYVLYQ